jgi:hypothetical protein
VAAFWGMKGKIGPEPHLDAVLVAVKYESLYTYKEHIFNRDLT